MDDQRGNVIDGTERARQWRRSRPKTGPTAESTEARSDAPKSLAGSLLVPAEMLPGTSTPKPGPDPTGHHSAALADSALTRAEQPGPAENGAYHNPFLGPEAACGEGHSGAAPRRTIAALLTSARGLSHARDGWPRPLPRLAALRRWRGELRLTRLLAVAALTGAIVITALIAARPNAGHPSLAPALSAPGPLLTPKTGSLIAANNPFAQHVLVRDRESHPARRVRAHRPVRSHRRPRPASKTAVVPVRYTPPTSDARVSVTTTATPSYAVSTPTAATSQSAPPNSGGTTTSSSSSSSRPAFGENGTLGPGRGAPGTQ
jgi:hypothetical protein